MTWKPNETQIGPRLAASLRRVYDRPQSGTLARWRQPALGRPGVQPDWPVPADTFRTDSPDCRASECVV